MCDSCEQLRLFHEARYLRQCENCNSINVHWVLFDEIEKVIADEFCDEAYDIADQTELGGIYFCFDCHEMFGFFPTGTSEGPQNFVSYWWRLPLKEKHQVMKEPYVFERFFDVLSAGEQKKLMNYVLSGSIRGSRTSP